MQSIIRYLTVVLITLFSLFYAGMESLPYIIGVMVVMLCILIFFDIKRINEDLNEIRGKTIFLEKINNK